MGLEQAGFSHEAAVEVNPTYCETLEANRPDWNVVCSDLADFDPTPYSGVDPLVRRPAVSTILGGRQAERRWR